MSEPLEVVEKKRIDREKQIKQDYEDLFNNAIGQRVLEDIKASGVWKRSAFSTDPYLMAANCAKQDFARHIVDMATKTKAEDDLPRKAKRKAVKK